MMWNFFSCFQAQSHEKKTKLAALSWLQQQEMGMQDKLEPVISKEKQRGFRGHTILRMMSMQMYSEREYLIDVN